MNLPLLPPTPRLQLSALCELGGQETVVLVHTHMGRSYVSCCALGAEGVGQPASVLLGGVGGREIVASCLCGSEVVVLCECMCCRQPA